MRLAVAFLMFASPAAAEWELLTETPANPAVAQIIVDARADCLAETDSSDIRYSPELAFTETDLEGDQARDADGVFNDMVVDFNYLGCKFGNIWAGTGGAPVHFVLNGATSASWTGFNWQLVRYSEYTPVLILLGRHGSYCDGYGAQGCVQAISVEDGAFSYVLDPGPNTTE